MAKDKTNGNAPANPPAGKVAETAESLRNHGREKRPNKKNPDKMEYGHRWSVGELLENPQRIRAFVPVWQASESSQSVNDAFGIDNSNEIANFLRSPRVPETKGDKPGLGLNLKMHDRGRKPRTIPAGLADSLAGEFADLLGSEA